MVTHDPLSPRGCKLYDFSSIRFPSVVVKKETGQECMSFKEKPNKRPLSIQKE